MTIFHNNYRASVSGPQGKFTYLSVDRLGSKKDLRKYFGLLPTFRKILSDHTGSSSGN